MQSTQPRTRLWSKYFILICLASLLGSAMVFMLDNTLSIYANDVWGSKSAAGLLTTTFTAGSILAAAMIGNVVDKFGRRIVLIVGFGCLAVGTALMMVSDAVWFNMCCRVLQGIGKGVFGVAGMSVAADIIPRDRLGEGMGYFGLGSTLAQAIGPALGLAIIAGGNYMLLFGSSAGLCFLCVLIAFFLTYEKKEPYRTQLEESRREAAAAVGAASAVERRGIWKIFEKGAIFSSAVVFFYGAGTTCILVYLTLYATEVLHISNPGTYFTAAAAVMLITRLFVGKIVDRRGVLGVVAAGFLCGIVGEICMIRLAENYVVFLFCGVMYGLSMALIYPALSAAIIIDSPKDRKGAANSTLGFLLDGGILISSALMGFVTETYGYTVMFLMGAAFSAVGLVLALIFLNNKARASWRKKLGVE